MISLIPSRVWNGLTVFQLLFAIGSRRRGGALQLGDRGHHELCGPAEVMRVKDSLNVLERAPRDGRDFGHLATGLLPDTWVTLPAF
jgi:hypothetical protein